jgi:hypothetical protein
VLGNVAWNVGPEGSRWAPEGRGRVAVPLAKTPSPTFREGNHAWEARPGLLNVTTASCKAYSLARKTASGGLPGPPRYTFGMTFEAGVFSPRLASHCPVMAAVRLHWRRNSEPP